MLTKDILRLTQGVAEINFKVSANKFIPTKMNSLETYKLPDRILKCPAHQLQVLKPGQTENVKALECWMRSRRYSESTISMYTEALFFLRYFPNKAAEDITNKDLIVINNQYIIFYKLSASYQSQLVNAVKLFFRTIQLRYMDVELIHRPKRAKLLPNVVSKEEVKSLLTAPVKY